MKILIADQQAVYRDGLKHNLRRVAQDAVVLDAASFGQIYDVLQQNKDVDLILTDIDMLEPNWEQRVRELLSSPIMPRVGIITAKENQLDAQKAKNIGLCCYLPKNIESQQLEQVLDKVLQGEDYYDNIGKGNKDNKNRKLTNRQFEVLKYLAEGLSNKQIAYQMNVSEATVKLHINALLRAIEATNRTQAVVKSQKLGII